MYSVCGEEILYSYERERWFTALPWFFENREYLSTLRPLETFSNQRESAAFHTGGSIYRQCKGSHSRHAVS